MTTPRMDRVAYGRTLIVYEIRRRDTRRTIAITVNPDASVTVAVPKGTRRVRIAAEVRRKAAWVIKQQDWLRRHYPPRPREFVSGETFLYLGRQYHLRVQRDASATRPGMVLTRGMFCVSLPPDLPIEAPATIVRDELVRWYRVHAQTYVRDMCETVARRLGVQHESVRLLDMKTRWGSGGSNGRLRFNWRIVMAPRSLVEYVVAHELCHIRHGQHSPAFWRLLGCVMPDYQSRRERLDMLGPMLGF